MASRAPALAARDLTEPVIPGSVQVPRSRKLSALVLAGAALAGSLALGVWLLPRLVTGGPRPLTATTSPALVATTDPAAAKGDGKHAAAAPAAAAPAAPSTPPTTPAGAGAAATAHSAPVAARAPASSTADNSSIPWLDGSVIAGCTPAAVPAELPSPQDQAKSQQEYAKGRRLLVQGKLTPSLNAFCEAARLNPLHSGLAFEVARAALIARDAVTAARFAERSLALTPPDRRSRELLADALAWQGDVEAARAAWLSIHKLPAPTEKTLANLALGAVLEARTAAKQGDYSTSERYLRRALVFDPENATTTTDLARVLFLAGHHGPANSWIQRALSLNAAEADRQVLAGDIRDKLGDRASALRHYERALETDPRHALAKLKRSALEP